MKHRYLLASLVIALIPAIAMAQGGAKVSPAQPSVTAAQDEAAIREMEARHAEAWGKGNMKAYRATIADDHVDLDLMDHTPQLGIEAIMKDMTAAAARRPAALRISATTNYVRVIDAKTAFVFGTWKSEGNPGGRVTRGTWLHVVTKRDGNWKIVAEQISDDLPMMPDPKPKKPTSR